MKQTLRRHLTNIVFLVLIVAAALAIYLLSRAENGALASIGAQVTAAAETPAPTEAVKEIADPLGVPEAVFATHLAASEVFTAEQDHKDERAYELSYGESPPVTAQLRYEVQNGCVSSIELTFALPGVYKDKGKTSIEAYLYEASKKLELALPDAVRAVLSDVLPASDAKDELQTSSVRYWTEQAMQLKKVGDDFEDVLSGYRFLAYRSQGETAQELVCILYLI